MEKTTKKLLDGAIIYFIGNALTQLMSLMLLRFVTGHIASEDYGYYNLVVTVSNLVIPFVTLQLTDAIFKFFIRSESEDERKKYFSVTMLMFIISTIVIVLGVLLLDAFFLKIEHPILVTLYMVANTFYVLYHRIVRSLGRNKVYVSGNLIKTASYLLLQIFLIYCFNFGVETLFLSTIISEIIFLIYAEIRVHSFKLFSVKSIEFGVLKSMLKFSVPLIPNAVFWWLTSSVNTMIVSYKCGLDINGIYTVANKFSGVLTMVTSVFIMSWQELAIAEYGKDNFKKFFTDTFNMYAKVVTCVIAMLVPFMKAVFPFIIDESYYASISYAPFLLIVSGFSTLSGFLAQIFVGQGKTYRSLWTSVVGMVFNIVIVFAFVDKIGLWAVIFGSMAADGVMFLLRLILVRREFGKNIQYFQLLVSMALLAVSIVLYMNFSTIYNVIWLGVAIGISLFLNFGVLKDISHVLLSKIKKTIPMESNR